MQENSKSDSSDHPAPGGGALPPPPPPAPNRKSESARQILSVLLSLCLGIFLADAVVSLIDDSLILLFDIYVLTVVRGLVFLCAIVLAFVTYCLMGLTPMIPKRLFLPVTLFNPVAGLVLIPFLIYFYSRMPQMVWAISLGQVLFGLGILYWVQRGFKFHWPLVTENHLAARRFSWRNLSVFFLVNVLVVLPAVLFYLVFCANRAVDHFSEGFLALRPDGLIVQVRKYARDDGKTIQLYPMSHVGDSAFYRKLAQSFPTNSITLMEGVTDNRGLLTNKITYKRMATSLGLSEQQTEFQPRGEMVRADLDVEEFSSTTIDLLNLIMLVHSKGMNPDVVLRVTQYSPPQGYEERLWDDLLRKRNRRLLEEIQTQLPHAENLIVPWGAAHMPEIAREIQKIGFRLVESTEHVAIRFRPGGNKPKR